MTQKELDHFRNVLRRLAHRVRQDTESVTELARGASGGQAAGELSNAPMHLGDMGTEEYLQDLNATLLENGEYLVNEALAALRRIDEGTFGTCEDCQSAIARERLRALPATRFCIACAESHAAAGRLNLNTGRPLRPSDTLAPEGEMGERRRRRSDSTQADDRIGPESREDDVHASGTAGGGTAVGGLAGSNTGHGDPDTGVLEDAMGSSDFDLTEGRDN